MSRRRRCLAAVCLSVVASHIVVLLRTSRNANQALLPSSTRRDVGLFAVFRDSTAEALCGKRTSLVDREANTRSTNVQRRIAAGHAADGVRVSVAVKYNCDDGGNFANGDFSKPLEFVVGAGEVVPGLEQGVKGMTIGQSKLLSFGPSNSLFGPRDETRIFAVPSSELPAGSEVGSQIIIDGESVIVSAMNDTTAVLDFNHPLAARGLTVAITLLSCEQVVLASDVQIQTITPGDGKTYPQIGDNVRMHYIGSIAATGAVFDSSRERGETFSFRIGLENEILGWDEGIMRMSLGERATLRIPAEKAYGARGNGKEIPANADLIFDVELLDIYSDFLLAD